MPDRQEVQMSITGTGKTANSVSYEIEHVELEDGEMNIVRVTFDLWEFEISVDFNVDEADQFLTRFRDEVVRAKQSRLEWETDTDPSTGVSEECES